MTAVPGSGSLYEPDCGGHPQQQDQKIKEGPENGQKRRFGKGLNALFLDNEAEESGSLMRLRLSDVEPNKDQPGTGLIRKPSRSWRIPSGSMGCCSPLWCGYSRAGTYQIIAGERRWRASRLAEQRDIPAIVVDADDNKVMELALIENLQREDLTVIEEAQGYKALMETYGMTQEQVAARVGKSRPVIANALRLLSLPPRVLDELENGGITPAMARVLAGVEEERIDSLLDRVIVEGLTVRQLKQLAKKPDAPAKEPKEKEKSAWGDSYYKEVELSLRDTLGRKVKVRKKGDTGTLEIQFYSREELEDLAARLAKEEQ